jgi:integrase
MMPLNIQTIMNTKCPEGKRSIDLRDGGGLSLRVTKTGIKTWRYEYRIGSAGKQKKKLLIIGHFPSTSLADARIERDRLKVSRKDGIDPADKKKNDIKENKAREQARSSEETVDDLINEYINSLDGQPSQREISQILNKEVGAQWSKRSASSITRHECTRLLNKIKGRAPVRSNRVYSYMKAMFKRGVLNGLIETSPMTISEKPYKQEKGIQENKKKDKPLSQDEIKTLHSTLTSFEDNPTTRGAGQLYANILLMQLWTGARPAEILNMKWSQIDNNIWTLGLGEHKTGHKVGREIRRPLVEPALEIIKRQSEETALVFPSMRTGDAMGTAALGNWINRNGKLGIDGFSAHHLRHTFATHARAIGIRPDLVERILGHVADSGIAEVYSTYDWIPEMQAALEKWHRWIMSVCQDQNQVSNVVNLPSVFQQQ